MLSTSIIRELKDRKHFSLFAEGQSMSPILRFGDLVFYKKIPFPKIKLGDLMIVERRSELFTHRVIYRTKDCLITKGDNNIKSDGKIYPKHLIAKVEKVERNSRIFVPQMTNQYQASLYFSEINKIKEAFEKEKIDFVFLKGLLLHFYYEKTYPDRIYHDCDVLVNKRDWQLTEKILDGFNYRKTNTSYSRIHKILKDKQTELVHTKRIHDFPVVFDIHLEAGFLMNQLGRLDALYSQRFIDTLTREFLIEKQLVKIQNQYFPILSPVNLIIYLSLHFFHHNYRGIFRLELIHKILKREYKSKNIFYEISGKIKQYQLQNFVYPVFLLSEKYYDLKLPKVFLDSIKPDNSRLRYIKENILNVNIFDDEARIQSGIYRFTNLFFLSPHPLFKKVTIVLNLQVIYSLFWAITFLTKRSLIRMFKSSKI